LVPGIPDEPTPPLIGCELAGDDFRSWVLNGLPLSSVDSGGEASGVESHALQMPAYSTVVDEADAEDLHAWALIAGHKTPSEEMVQANRVAAGDALASKHGCYRCHGDLGQGGVPNPGSLTGEVPPLTGDEFDHLSNGGQPEAVEEWIRMGRSEAFLAGNPLAPAGRWFMDRQLVQMPPYEEILNEEEIQILVEFCLYLGGVGPMTADSYVEHSKAMRVDEDHSGGSADTAVSAVGDSTGIPAPIAEILSSHCIRCHGPKKQKSDYRMDTREHAMAKGEIAEFLGVNVIEAGDPSSSLLVIFINAAEEDPENEIFPMPPEEKDRLTEGQINLISDWIASGAPWHESQELTSTYTEK